MESSQMLDTTIMSHALNKLILALKAWCSGLSISIFFSRCSASIGQHIDHEKSQTTANGGAANKRQGNKLQNWMVIQSGEQVCMMFCKAT
jgi:hypothetical protein